MKRTSDVEPRQPSRGWFSLALAVALVSLVGLLLWASPFGQTFEREHGLELAFLLRGERQPPNEAIYIPIDRKAADALCKWLPVNPENGRCPTCDVDNLPPWVRRFVAELIDTLADAGAALIVVDLHFGSLGDVAEDRQLAEAIRRAGNVVLLSGMLQHDDEVSDGDQLLLPQALFANEAAASAPSPLPRDARRDRFVTFVNLGDRRLATLQTVALYLYERKRNTVAWRACSPLTKLEAVAGPAGVLEELRESFTADSVMLSEWRAEPGCERFMQSAVGRLTTAPDERFFNFYQGVGTFSGPFIDSVVENASNWEPSAVEGKVVFIGVDDHSDRDPDDSHRTAVGEADFSGVELVATGFVNLLHEHDIKLPTVVEGIVTTFVVTSLIGLLFLMPRGGAIVGSVLVAWGYIHYCAYRFDQDNLLLPIVIPLFVVVPMMIALGWRWQLGRMERLADALNQFVPQSAKDWWVRIKVSEEQRQFGVCMHTDVAGYTPLSERYASTPEKLRELEREYWSLVDAEIVREHGRRFDLAGDGMLCVWIADKPDEQAATRACRAALAIQRVVDAFNERHPDTKFETRIGLHAGPITVGPVGGGDSFTMTVGGDVPNTAARIENDLNKQLGTRLLVSEAVAELATSVQFQRIGEFVLRGKLMTVVIYAPNKSDSPVHTESV